MKKIISKLHYLAFIWAGASSFGAYEEYQSKNDELKLKKAEITQSIAIQTKKRNQAKEYESNIEELKNKLSIINREFELTKKRFPSNISDSEIRDISNNVKLKKFLFQFKAEEIKDFYVKKSYQLQASGTFLQFLLFFEQIEELKRILNFKSLILKVSNAKRLNRFQRLEGTAEIEIYGYNENFDIDAALGGDKEGNNENK